MTTTPTNALHSIAILHSAAAVSRDPQLLAAVRDATIAAAQLAYLLGLHDARAGVLGTGHPAERELSAAIASATAKPMPDIRDTIARLAICAAGDRDLEICADSAGKCLASLAGGIAWLSSDRAIAEHKARNALRPTPSPRMPYGATREQLRRTAGYAPTAESPDAE
ncbi:hypothetical protein GWI72_10550 [Microvirga tunisiensis]|uniref:Uncharacterized protein n=1 Tax=Pannonibacter tanglangensis TaxID=2750084 RepID=A0A7X5J9P6_9HYPH|nr:hypothetical protein [Pannonibacter sp. XCT-53]NBN78706.1 hypothetical protein [Pannonibacter sp. XCT-53]